MFAKLATTAITGTTPMEMAHWQKRKWHLYLFILVWPEALQEDSQLFWLEICVFWTRYPRGQRFESCWWGGISSNFVLTKTELCSEHVCFETCTLEINGWNLKNHPIEQENNHLPSTSILGLHVNFRPAISTSFDSMANVSWESICDEKY